MKVKAIKYNHKGLTRAENSVQKFVMPKSDLTKSNIKIETKNNYIIVTKKEKKPQLTTKFSSYLQSFQICF